MEHFATLTAARNTSTKIREGTHVGAKRNFFDGGDYRNEIVVHNTLYTLISREVGGTLLRLKDVLRITPSIVCASKNIPDDVLTLQVLQSVGLVEYGRELKLSAIGELLMGALEMAEIPLGNNNEGFLAAMLKRKRAIIQSAIENNSRKNFPSKAPFYSEEKLMEDEFVAKAFIAQGQKRRGGGNCEPMELSKFHARSKFHYTEKRGKFEGFENLPGTYLEVEDGIIDEDSGKVKITGAGNKVKRVARGSIELPPCIVCESTMMLSKVEDVGSEFVGFFIAKRGRVLKPGCCCDHSYLIEVDPAHFI